MVSSLPNIKVLVDWDGDGFFNDGVPKGAPPNLVPYAAFPRAADYRSAVDESYTSEFLYDNPYGLVARTIALTNGQRAIFGGRFSKFWYPTTTPNIIDGYYISNIVHGVSGDYFKFQLTDNGYASIVANSTGQWSGTFIGDNGSANTIPVVSGHSYTFLVYLKTKIGSANSTATLGVQRADRTTIITTHANTVTNGWAYVQFTAPATENVRFYSQLASTTGTEYVTGFMLIEGTYTTPPDGFNVYGITTFPNGGMPVVLQPTTVYYAGFTVISDVNTTLTVKIYRMKNGAATAELYQTDTVSLTADIEKRLDYSISSHADAKVLFFTASPNNTASLSFYGYSINESGVIVKFSAGGLIGYDRLSDEILAAQWQLGRRKYDEPLPYEGTAEITLNNSDKLFSPKNVDSPLYGYFKKNLAVRIDLRDPLTLVWSTVWRGWTHMFDLTIGEASNQQARLTCNQGLFRLRENEVDPLVQETKTLDEVIPDLLDMAGWRNANHPAGAFLDYNYRLDYNSYLPDNTGLYERQETGVNTYDLVGEGWGNKTTVEQALDELLAGEGASFWVGREGLLNFVNRTFYLYRSELIDATINLDTGVQSGSYEYMRDLTSAVTIYTKPKNTEKNIVVWQTQPAIDLNAGESKEIEINFLFEEGSKKTITNVKTSDVNFTAYTDSYSRSHVATEEINSSDYDKLNVYLNTDGEGRYTLVLASQLNYKVWIHAEITGDAFIGGDGEIHRFDDADSIRLNNAEIVRSIESSAITSTDEAEALAQFYLLRNDEPHGEFTSLVFIGNALPLIRTGDRLLLSEGQTEENLRAHVVLGETANYITGGSLKYTFDLGRLDEHHYAYEADALMPERLTIMELPENAQVLGAGFLDYVVRLESNILVPRMRVVRKNKAIYGIGFKPAKRIDLGRITTAQGAILFIPTDYNDTYGEFEQFVATAASALDLYNIATLKPNATYRLRMTYRSHDASDRTITMRGIEHLGAITTIYNLQDEDGNAASFNFPKTTGSEWGEVEYYFQMKDFANGKPMNIMGMSRALGSSGIWEIGTIDIWEKYPATLIEPSSPYTVHVALRLGADYSQKAVNIRVIETVPPPYSSGDGDTTVHSFQVTPSANEVTIFSSNFTSSSTGAPIRLEIEFNAEDTIDRYLEIYEAGIIEGSTALTELGLLYNENAEIARLAP